MGLSFIEFNMFPINTNPFSSTREAFNFNIYILLRLQVTLYGFHKYVNLTHLKISSQKWLRTRVNYTPTPKEGQNWLIKGSFWQYWPFTMGQNWLMKGHFLPFLCQEWPPLLVNFDPLLKLVYSWLLIFKCEWKHGIGEIVNKITNCYASYSVNVKNSLVIHSKNYGSKFDPKRVIFDPTSWVNYAPTKKDHFWSRCASYEFDPNCGWKWLDLGSNWLL